jgi:hypothetical protein
MWRLRRATRCESGSVRESAIWADRSIWSDGQNQRSLELPTEIWVLEEAEEQLRNALAKDVRAGRTARGKSAEDLGSLQDETPPPLPLSGVGPQNTRGLAMQCRKKKRDGNQCGARARTGKKYCPLHSEPGKAAEFGRKGGLRRTIRNPEELKEFPVPKSAADLRDLLARSIVEI